MKRRFILNAMTLTSTIVLLLVSRNSIGEVNIVELTKSIMPTVARILTYDEENFLIGSGSGFFVDNKGKYLTNYHVLENAFSAKLVLSDSSIYDIKWVVGEDKESDAICLIPDAYENNFKPVKITTKLPEIAERILVIGSPKGLEGTVTEGIISAIRHVRGFGEVFQISAPISPGSSGSPLINMQGNVIGIASFQIKEGQNLNFAIPIGRIVNLLKTRDEISLTKRASSHRSRKVLEILDSVKIGMNYNQVNEAVLNITGNHCVPGFQNIEYFNNECHWSKIGFSFNRTNNLLSEIFLITRFSIVGTKYERDAKILMGWVEGTTYFEDIRKRKDTINRDDMLYKYVWGE